MTRGVSPLEAAEAVRAFGAEPVMIISVVDRGGTCEQLAKEAGISFHTLLTAPDFDSKSILSVTKSIDANNDRSILYCSLG